MTDIYNEYLQYVNKCGKICDFVNNCTSKKLPPALCTSMSQMVTMNNANEIIDFCKQNQKYNFFDLTAIA